MRRPPAKTIPDYVTLRERGVVGLVLSSYILCLVVLQLVMSRVGARPVLDSC
jgi:hypothetical protein